MFPVKEQNSGKVRQTRAEPSLAPPSPAGRPRPQPMLYCVAAGTVSQEGSAPGLAGAEPDSGQHNTHPNMKHTNGKHEIHLCNFWPLQDGGQPRDMEGGCHGGPLREDPEAAGPGAGLPQLPPRAGIQGAVQKYRFHPTNKTTNKKKTKIIFFDNF